jgi:parvulin-like peptidyl-prolyl isomerase
METNYPVFALFATLIWLQAQPVAGTEIVAMVNGEPITAAEVEESIKPQLEAIEQQLERLRRTVLPKLIDNRLLEQAARGDGVSADAYLRARVGDRPG